MVFVKQPKIIGKWEEANGTSVRRDSRKCVENSQIYPQKTELIAQLYENI
jgi:hypothetical protein